MAAAQAWRSGCTPALLSSRAACSLCRAETRGPWWHWLLVRVRMPVVQCYCPSDSPCTTVLKVPGQAVKRDGDEQGTRKGRVGEGAKRAILPLPRFHCAMGMKQVGTVSSDEFTTHNLARATEDSINKAHAHAQRSKAGTGTVVRPSATCAPASPRTGFCPGNWMPVLAVLLSSFLTRGRTL